MASTSSGPRAADCALGPADVDEPLGSIGDGAVHVLPVLEPGLQEPTAHLHLTANPRRPWDALLQTYAQLCSAHVAMALSGLRRLHEVRHRAEVLTAHDTAKSDFFANVSHELRTPLTLIAGPVQDALRNPDLGEESRERFELIRRNTDRLVGLVDRILDLTRVEAGAVEAHWVRADVGRPRARPRGQLPTRHRATRPRLRRRARRPRTRHLRRRRHARAHRAQPAVERAEVHAARDAS